MSITIKKYKSVFKDAVKRVKVVRGGSEKQSSKQTKTATK
jgi:hypothetical protein